MESVIRRATLSSEQLLLTVPVRPDGSQIMKPPAPEVSPVQQRERAEQAIATIEEAYPEPDREETEGDGVCLPEDELAAKQQLLEAKRVKILEDAQASGYDAGMQEASRAFAQSLAAIEELANSMRTAWADCLSEQEDVILDIAFEAVCKIVGNSLQERDGVLSIVREVVSRAKENSVFAIHVSPIDYELLQKHKTSLVSEFSAVKVDIVPDDRVALGGCMIEMEGSGALDGRLETQIQQLRELIVRARRQRSGMAAT